MSAWRSRLIFGAGALVLLLVLAAYLGYQQYRANQPVRPRLDVDKRFKAIRESPGHLVHIQNQGLACEACHAISDQAARRFDVPSSDICIKCHTDQPVVVHDSDLARAGTECKSCHTFGED